MAFIDIKDPIKREETVQDYIKNIKEIRARSENKKVHDISQRQDLAKVFQPVVQATEKSASQITNELKNLKEEPKQEEPKPTNKAVEYYLNQFSKSKLDQYFGIYKENGIYMMGTKEVVIDDVNNIRIDNGADAFKGTPALWRLIMHKAPEVYEPEDFENYKRLLHKTNAIDMPHTTSAADRPRSTAKWKFFKENGLVEPEVDEEEGEKENFGSGIQFLPGDINGLIRQLHLLLAESRAGNKSSTRNQIVAILDQLLRLNYLNQEEYNAVCEEISC
jgi:hypothetical protein